MIVRTLACILFLCMAGLCIGGPKGASAHEMQASIADITLADGRVSIALRTNLEARLAGITAEHDDTADAPQAVEYDALRRLPPDQLEARLAASDLASRIQIETQAGPVPLTITQAEVPSVGNLALARESRLTFEGDLPPAVGSVIVSAPDFGDLVLRGMGANIAYSEYLRGEPSQAIAVAGATERGFAEVFVQYLGVGFEHIIPLGLDHILFVIGLFLLSPRLVPLLWQVSAFTLAHTATLALGALELVRVPAEIVEPLIALSIVYVCVENLYARGLTTWRPALVFAFGLLHGLGFASVFEAYGIPEGQFVAALLAFNIGVEAGQLVVLAVCFLAVGLWFRDRSWYRAAVTVPGSLAVGAVGLYWAVTRFGLVDPFLPGL